MNIDSKDLVLGMDAGGTFTDMVLYDQRKKSIVGQSKVPTLHGDLSKTIAEGLDIILTDGVAEKIGGINLATTFATNAVIEGKLRPAGLILIGYKSIVIENFFRNGNDLGTDKFFMVEGGHDLDGEEQMPLDEIALMKQAEKLRPEVEAFAISGYFSTRNPEHEIRALQKIKERWPDMPITCGHEITSELNAPVRAATATLNAGLIPVVMDLFLSFSKVCRDRGLNAPMNVVRGDGSLVGEDWAKLHPIEMILSGPAASAVGAKFLTSMSKLNCPSWVVDIGGTTTDIIPLHADGLPKINKMGACVGKYRTLIRAIDIYTFGQGGDSKVYTDKDSNILVGPKRIVPICVAASQFPHIEKELAVKIESEFSQLPLFIMQGIRMAPQESLDQKLQSYVSKKPHMVSDLNQSEEFGYFTSNRLERLMSADYISLAGFTPTDAMHVLGLFQRWNKNASESAAEIIGEQIGISAKEVAELTLNKVAVNIALCVFRKSCSQFFGKFQDGGEAELLLRVALSQTDTNFATINLNLNAAIIGIGAPSSILMPEVGRLLNQEVLLPQRAEVAGAVGAATGAFDLNYSVLITVKEYKGFRVHHWQGITDYSDLEEAVSAARELTIPWLKERSIKAGAVSPNVKFERKDVKLRKSKFQDETLLWSELMFQVTDDE